MSSQFGKQILIKRVHSRSLRKEVYELRYRAYRSIGALNVSRNETFSDAYDKQENHILWALSLNDRVIGSIRTMWFDPAIPFTIPEQLAYGADILRVTKCTDRLVSGNRFVTDPDLSIKGSNLAMLLLRHYMVVAQAKCDVAIAAVQIHHLPFYKRVLKLTRISDGFKYPGLNAIMYLTACNFQENIKSVYEKHPLLKPLGNEHIFLKDEYKHLWEVGLPVEENLELFFNF